MRAIYLDHNATTKPDPKVVAAMMEALELFGNPSSSHRPGQRAAAIVETARQRVADLLGAAPTEIHFTGCGTEANNSALRGAAYARAELGQRIVSTTIEHPSITQTLKDLAGRGFEVVSVPVGLSGRVDPAAVAEAINDETILVSVMAANNETGVLQPIREIGEIARDRGALMHVDAIQYAGKMKIDLADWPVDLLSISAHKFHGPKGVGALYVRAGVNVMPRILGGGQEFGMRGGTENVPGIAGLGAAAALAHERVEAEGARIGAMRDRFEATVRARIPDTLVIGDVTHRLPNTSNLSLLDAEGEAVSINLDLKGVSVSTGSACSSGATASSHVLVAMGLPGRQIDSAIRFSLGKDNADEELDEAIAILAETVERIRSISR